MQKITINSIRGKIKAITYYLMENARYQNTPLRQDEAEATATYYANKLDIHNCTRESYYDHDDDNEYLLYKFEVKVGKPVFRGSINYTLPEHSLQFNSLHPSRVSLRHNEEMPKWINSVAYAIMGHNSSHWEESARDKLYSFHPHISDYGEPCLGGWANAWSACVATGNIMSLIPVAQSFLNTWTRNDAYWDINHVYQGYRRIPASIRKVFPINNYFQAYKFWFQITHRCEISRPRRTTDFGRWCTSNKDLVEHMIFNMNIDPIKLFIIYRSVETCQRMKADTENKEKVRMMNAKWIMTEIMELAQAKFTQAISGANMSQFITPLLSEALLDRRGLYITSIWSHYASGFYPELNRLRDYVDSHLQSVIRNSTRNSSPIDATSILSFMRHCHKQQLFKADVYLTTQDMIDALEYYSSRMGSDVGQDMIDAFNNLSELLGVGTTMLAHTNTDSSLTIAKEYRNILLDIDSFKQNMTGEKWDELADKVASHITHIALDNLERLAVNLVTDRIQNGKNQNKKQVRVATGSVGDDAQQSHLFAEAF